MVLQKEPCGRWIIHIIHITPIEFDMFKLNNDDAYVSLQAPKSIDESMQPIMIVGGSTIVCWWFGGQCVYKRKKWWN
jgi:hypothetical protein